MSLAEVNNGHIPILGSEADGSRLDALRGDPVSDVFELVNRDRQRADYLDRMANTVGLVRTTDQQYDLGAIAVFRTAADNTRRLAETRLEQLDQHVETKTSAELELGWVELYERILQAVREDSILRPPSATS